MMKWLISSVLLGLGVAGMANGDEPPQNNENHLTVQDLDRQIQLLKDNIEKYNGLANAFDRKADNLRSHDFSGYRNAATMSQECRGIAKDLEAHLATLEAQRAEMAKQQSQKK